MRIFGIGTLNKLLNNSDDTIRSPIAGKVSRDLNKYVRHTGSQRDWGGRGHTVTVVS